MGCSVATLVAPGEAGNHVAGKKMKEDLCQVVMEITVLIKQGNPDNSEFDSLLMCCIRRANLDAFWGREASTVYQNWLDLQRQVNLLKL
eukprot:5367128-Ditylum_brightwellii.AAC.1